MKKLLLTLILTVISNSVMAEWVEFIKGDKETQTLYVDPTTIHKNGDNVKIRFLSDYKKGPGTSLFTPIYVNK